MLQQNDRQSDGSLNEGSNESLAESEFSPNESLHGQSNHSWVADSEEVC